MEKISCYCQNCRAANTDGETNCRQCGTRLLLIVFPSSSKYDNKDVPTFYEDHLLERVSLLEMRLAQVFEQLGMAFEIIKRESKSIEKDHALLQTYFELIQNTNPELSELLKANLPEAPRSKKENIQLKTAPEYFLEEILASHTNPNIELFTLLIEDGINLLSNNEDRQAFRNLERAALLSPRNVPLKIFIAEKLFWANKLKAAEKYLKTAFEIAPQNEKNLFLLSAIYADFAHVEKARKFLDVLKNNADKLVCVNYIDGMLAAFEANWARCVAAFKEATNASNAPEINFLIGCGYFESNDYSLALGYFKKANLIDSQFADAWFMQSIVYKILGDSENEYAARTAALDSKETGAQCLQYLSGEESHVPETALPFAHFKEAGKHLLTGGSPRLTKFFKSQMDNLVR